MRPSKATLIVSATAIWIGALLGLYHVVKEHIGSPAANPFYVISYVAALVAMAGWMVQATISVRNSRKQHTINVLFQSRMNPEFINHAQNVMAYFPGDTSITMKSLSDHPDKSLYESIRFVLNYYEFIAVGIRHGDLDEPLLRDCLCSQMCTFCKRCEDIIKTARGEDECGRPAPDKIRILKNLRWLQMKWIRVARKSARLPIRAKIARFFCQY